MAAATLAIAHVEGSSPPAFTLTRLTDGRSAAPVTISSPYAYPVESQPNSNLMEQLRWYLEHFLDYPFDPEIGHAGRVLDALQARRIPTAICPWRARRCWSNVRGSTPTTMYADVRLCTNSPGDPSD